MGSNESDAQAGSDEKPQHRVYLDAYWIDRTEVTNVMFAACVTAGACHPRKYTPYQWGVSSRTRDDYFNNPAYDDYPVIMLDGDEAQAYCHWVGRHLPTEAEWEKAARGTDGRQYPWGEGIDCQQANYLGCLGDTARVGSLLAGASPYGVLDMAGNLWEWTADWYDAGYYQRSPARNPTGPAEGNYRTLRGGSWGSTAYALHSTNRADGKPEHWADGELGFRCAISE